VSACRVRNGHHGGENSTGSDRTRNDHGGSHGSGRSSCEGPDVAEAEDEGEDHHRPGEDGHAGYRVLDRISRGRLSDFGGGRRGRHDAVIKPKPLQAPVEGGFTVDDFTLDEEAGTVGRPAGNTRPIRRTRMASFCAPCRRCPPPERCTKSKIGRKIVLHQQDDLLRKARRDDVRTFPQPSGISQRVAARAS
jgi:hypothetical protein